MSGSGKESRRLILGSGSPRRKALLAALGVPFNVMRSDADEIFEGPSPSWIVETNACRKRDDVAQRVEEPAIIIAADTLVFWKGHVLGKPADRTEAIATLRKLSGHTHEVCTGLALIDTRTGRRIQGTEVTHVMFRNLTDSEIDRFVDVVNPVDRAGAYTCDGPGSLLVSGFQGCYHNVLGLPIIRLDLLLRELNFHLFDHLDADAARFL